MSDCRIAFRCLELMKDLLREEYNALKVMQERGQGTKFTEFTIERMEYALGLRETKPSYADLRRKD